MKNLKKILLCVLAIATLSYISIIPAGVNAYTTYNIGDSNEGHYKYLEEHSFTEAVIIYKNYNETINGTYYYKNTENNGFPIKVDDDFDTTNIKKVIVYDKDNYEYVPLVVDTGYRYTFMWLDIETGDWFINETGVLKQSDTVDESTSITEFTVGESTYPRGDINLDGNVNTVDLLMLKKYLLGLMEW